MNIPALLHFFIAFIVLLQYHPSHAASAGDPCTKLEDCISFSANTFNLFCSSASKTCEQRKPENSACTSTEECQLTFVCAPTRFNVFHPDYTCQTSTDATQRLAPWVVLCVVVALLVCCCGVQLVWWCVKGTLCCNFCGCCRGRRDVEARPAPVVVVGQGGYQAQPRPRL